MRASVNFVSEHQRLFRCCVGFGSFNNNLLFSYYNLKLVEAWSNFLSLCCKLC